jgi:ParB family transcriptional regulator, chromosome partitioning protein
MSEVKRGLGRGLSALLGDVAREEPLAGAAGRAAGVQLLPVASIDANPGQPRRHFAEEALEDLARSIAARGLIQPIVVRPRGDRFELVAGERRWRAAQRARIHELPAIVREMDDAQTFELAIIENVQREDLNAIEEAEAYQRLTNDYGHTQEALAKLVGKSRSHVANLMRLLDLPNAVREMVADGRLSMGHARALITAPDPVGVAEEALRRGLSVRQVEALAKPGSGARRREPQIEYKSLNADIDALERQLGDSLGLKVSVIHNNDRGGQVTISYATLDQLDMVCQRLSGGEI